MNEQKNTACRITAVVNSDFQVNPPQKMIMNCGIRAFSHLTGRSAVLKEKGGFFSNLLHRTELISSNSVDIISFLVSADLEMRALQLIADAFKLNIFGSGSVYSENVEVIRDSGTIALNSDPPQPQENRFRMQKQLTGICCIVLRGMGDLVARVALETGSCVPTITYGQGAGLRDRLGLWRITIPAEKEIVTLIVNSFEVEEIMSIIVDSVKLDQPGKGFIYQFPVHRGLINMKVSQGTRSQAASMEQVVLALDEIKGGTEWRRRRLSVPFAGIRQKRFLTNLKELALHCDEGNGEDYVKIAMGAGASGATISEYRHLQSGEPRKVSPAREKCSIIVPPELSSQVVTHFRYSGVLAESSNNDLLIRSVPKAYSYSAQ
ncbi:MAG: hypothetical protein ACLFQB_00340 [Chitinispirillaceae bacterium]